MLEFDRTRRHTAPAVLEKIDAETRAELHRLSGANSSHISDRLKELDGEWDVDRVIETHAAAVGLAGVVLGATVDRRFYLVTGLVSALTLINAVTGFYPPNILFRRLGVRTAREIERERYALKALRGDFDRPKAEVL